MGMGTFTQQRAYLEWVFVKTQSCQRKTVKIADIHYVDIMYS